MTEEIDEHKAKELNAALPKSLANEKLNDFLTSVADMDLAEIMEVEGFKDIPVFGTLFKIWNAGHVVNNELYFRKVVRFLEGLNAALPEDRAKFVEQLNRSGQTEKFGETILLLLERIDDTTKPGIIGRVMAAHINGHLDYDKAMRLAAIVNRCYAQDLEYLRNFNSGTQGKMSDVADALFSAGLLANRGMDGGSFSDPDAGGIIYDLNEYGKLLQTHGWS